MGLYLFKQIVIGVTHLRPMSGGPIRNHSRCNRSFGPFSSEVMDRFDQHHTELKSSYSARKQAVQLRSVVTDSSEISAVDVGDMLGVRQPCDRWQGCTNLRTLRQLLLLVDDRGFERCVRVAILFDCELHLNLDVMGVFFSSPHQMAFHSSFERCVSRVIYKQDWGKDRPAIMKHNNWERCSSEVLISTPRRFGKTFRCDPCYVILFFDTILKLTFVYAPMRSSRMLHAQHCNLLRGTCNVVWLRDRGFQ